MQKKYYELLPLPYDMLALSPIISEEQLRFHHDKHHKAYVEAANSLLKSLNEPENIADFGNIARKLSFNIAGDKLHRLFWDNLKTPDDDNRPSDKLMGDLMENFGDFDLFRQQFFDIATTIEGSGWAVLLYDKLIERLVVGQIHNHDLKIMPDLPIMLVLDMWEHAYYLDYQNDKKTYAQNFWQIVNWETIEQRLDLAKA
jgi:Fe-Mn family superoxide dismutase